MEVITDARMIKSLSTATQGITVLRNGKRLSEGRPRTAHYLKNPCNVFLVAGGIAH
jgi:hypothetical protein